MDSRLLQLSDSAFPSGAFTHSYGFEALKQHGHLRNEESVILRLEELVWHTALGALPFLNDAYTSSGHAPVSVNVNDPVPGPGHVPVPRTIEAIDASNHAFLTNPIANRASKAQGQSFLLAAEATFHQTNLRETLPHGHVAVAMGAALQQAGLTKDQARQLHLFGAVRSAISAVIRLGVLGPLRAQRVLYDLHPLLDRALRQTENLTSDEATGCAPLLDLCQSKQDQLYSRLFQS